MDLYIAESEGKGRGVFAARPFKAGELIELCPVIVVPERDILEHTELFNYFFRWRDIAAICLGYGSLYNHSEQPNAHYAKKIEDRLIVFSALEKIAAGDEITVNYNSHHPGRELWFIEK